MQAAASFSVATDPANPACASHPARTPPVDLRLLDDPREWSAFSRPLNGQPSCWQSNVVFEGMHCAACAWTIEEALRKVHGVLSVEVSAASHRGRVTWSQDAVQPSGWMVAAQDAGYRALPANDSWAHERRRAQTRQALWRWSVAGLCMMQVMMYAWPAYVAEAGEMTPDIQALLRWASWVLTVPVLLFSCQPFFANALRDLRERRVSMDLPVALGMAITFVVSSLGTFEPHGLFGREVYFDSLTMFVFFLLTGRWLELRLRDRTAGALDALMNRLPDSVERGREDGSFERVAVRRLWAGDLIRVYPGETFPADGVLVDGDTVVDEALLTGESHPLGRGVGDVVIAGSHNLSGVVRVRVRHTGEQTRFAQIVALMESAALTRPPIAQLADRMARPFLLAVLLAAAAAAVYWWPQDPGKALMVAVAVLVVTCPCALSLATPAAMLASAGALARRGVLVRRLAGLQALAGVDTVVFDKTGTLTRDALALRNVRIRAGAVSDEALAQAAALARHSLHPLSRALVRALALRCAAQPGLVEWTAQAVQEQAGQGVSGQVMPVSAPGQAAAPATALRMGSAAFCGVDAAASDGLEVCLCDAQGWLASFEFQEDIRPDAAATVKALHAAGIEVRLLSGDLPPAVARVARQTGIKQARGGCTPQDKLAFLRRAQATGRKVAMVGDGLNDGPVLAGADVSFAFGQAVPLAQARADFVLLSEQLGRVAQTLLLARRTLRIVRQNLGWAAAYNALCVPLAMAGGLPAWLAGLGMAFSSLFVVLNALRLAGAMPALESD